MKALQKATAAFTHSNSTLEIIISCIVPKLNLLGESFKMPAFVNTVLVARYYHLEIVKKKEDMRNKNDFENGCFRGL